MTRAWQDCRYALRVLARNWRLVTVIVFTIAVTIGASTTLLSVIAPVLLKPLPFSDPERLFRIDPRDEKGQAVWISLPALTDWQDRLGDARVAGYSVFDFSVFGDEGPEPILAAGITNGLFGVLGARMTLGRAFEADEYRAGGPRGVVLSYAFWQRRYGSDPAVIGRSIELAGPTFLRDSSGDYRVVGVLAPEFWLFSQRLEIVVPLRLSAEQLANRRRSTIETVLAKFEPGVTEPVASARVSGVVRELVSLHGASEPTVQAATTDAQAAHFKEFRPRLLLALVSAILMFVLAVVNVAAMVIAMAVARRREFALRAALGISRFGLFSHAVTEGLLLGAAGGAIGLLLGWIGASVLRTVVPGPLLDRIPGQAGGVTIDAQVMALVAGAVILVSLVCGLTAFLASGGARLESTLREASRTTTEAPKHAKLRTAILASQLTLAVALVVTTSILSVSLVQLRSVKLGLNTERLVSFWLNLDARRYPSAPQRIDLFDRVIERVRAIPDVQSVSGIDLPANQNWQKTPIARADDGTAGVVELPEVFARAVTPEYFEMLGIGMVAGRAFAASDAAGTLPVAIVSRTLAGRLWPNRDPIGQQIRTGRADASEPLLTVVGVTADVRRVPQEPPTATVYRPVRQRTPEWLYLMIRARSESANLTTSVRQAVWADDPRQPVEGPFVIAKWVREMTALLHFIVLIGLTFSALGMLLAFSGVYGLTADLSQRAMREIGIRKALGATTAEIIRLYIVRSARPAIPALLAGGVAGTLLIRALASEFEGVASSQIWVTLLVIAVFGALVIVATYLAARRAADASPASTIRAD
jgi:putative ABC transport system permease protein